MDNLNQEQIKEIIKRGRKNGRVLHVSEAFKMYPVEDEDHKGKLEYFAGKKDNEAK